MVKRQLVPANICDDIPLPKVMNDEPKPMPEEEWLTLWGLKLSTEERVAYGLARFCGLRAGEIAGLTKRQFVWQPMPRIVDMRRKGSKVQGVKWDSCVEAFNVAAPHLGAEEFRQALRGHLKALSGDARVISWGASPASHYLSKRLSASKRRAGLVSPFGMHSLRHACATSMIDFGLPLEVVSRLLGHSSVNMTMRYVQVPDDPIRAWASQQTVTPGRKGLHIPT
jgi:integrase